MGTRTDSMLLRNGQRDFERTYEFSRLVLAAFVGSLLAIVFVLAWRSSQETGKSIPASLTMCRLKRRSSLRTSGPGHGRIHKRWGAVSDEESALESSLERAEGLEEALGI